MTRILKDGGVIVWIVGDAVINGSETLTSFEQALYFKNICKLNVHDVMIYEKNTFPFPSSNRYHQVFEYMFVLSKGKPKTFNPIIDEPVKYAGFTSRGRQTKRMPDGSLKETKKARIYADFKMRSNIWRYAIGKNNTTPDEIAYKHPALFPEKLVEDLILSWSNECDIVYDPMAGSGTTAKMAIKHNRNWILSEINKKYCNEIIKKRLKKK